MLFFNKIFILNNKLHLKTFLTKINSYCLDFYKIIRTEGDQTTLTAAYTVSCTVRKLAASEPSVAPCWQSRRPRTLATLEAASVRQAGRMRRGGVTRRRGPVVVSTPPRLCSMMFLHSVVVLEILVKLLR